MKLYSRKRTCYISFSCKHFKRNNITSHVNHITSHVNNITSQVNNITSHVKYRRYHMHFSHATCQLKTLLYDIENDNNGEWWWWLEDMLIKKMTIWKMTTVTRTMMFTNKLIQKIKIANTMTLMMMLMLMITNINMKTTITKTRVTTYITKTMMTIKRRLLQRWR